MAVVQVLSIGYDRVLVNLRGLVPQQAGYEVISAIGNEHAMILARALKFDLAIVGHSAPVPERQAMVEWLKQEFPEVPVIALCMTPGEKIESADAVSGVESPTEWLEAIALKLA
jgi:DNA-binding NarL/FixJ family response regulator